MKTAPDVAPELTPEEYHRLLIAKLTTRDTRKRLAAARALAAADPPAVPLLVAALADSTPEHKEAILSTLALMGWRARSAASAIEKLCDDEQLGAAAQEALRQIRRWGRIDREKLLERA